MRPLRIILFSFMAALLFTTTSCHKKELFDEEQYNEYVDDMFQVDGIDKNHDWCLTKDDTITVKVSDSRISSVKLLTDNPIISSSEIMAEGVCYGNQATLTYTLPLVANNIYIAALAEDGSYLGIKTTTYGTKEVELSLNEMQPIGSSFVMPTYQTFTYLYVCTFPLPSESFDYNDMVLRISKNNTRLENSLTVDLNVTLKAAGTKEQPYAGAIQLADIKYSDIDKVEIVEGKPMDDGYPLMRQFITSDAPLISGRNGEAVINLFESVHWSFGKQRDELGNVVSLIYNTTPSVQVNYSAKAEPIKRTYRIYFKDRNKARLLTLNRIDPFLIHEYNGGKWEIHTYPHKFDEVLYSIFTNKAAYDNHISWSIVIPKADFKYPIEGISLCSFDEVLEETFGPYEGFVGWMKDHTTHHNWYLNLKRPELVYQE